MMLDQNRSSLYLLCTADAKKIENTVYCVHILLNNYESSLQFILLVADSLFSYCSLIVVTKEISSSICKY